MTIALLESFSAFCKIMTLDCLDDVIQIAASYVTIKYRKSKHDRDITQIKLNFVLM